MLFVLILLLLLIFNKAKFYSANEFNTRYLSKDNTIAINGIFVLIVILRHYNDYVSFQGVYDEPFIILNKLLGQLLVVTFLFYSGYGMMEQVKKNGFNYIKNIPIKWIKLLIKFDFAVLLYLILELLLGQNYSLSKIFLSFLGWESLGNSNWYIFIILWLYILMTLSFIIIKKKNSSLNRYISTIILFLLSMFFVYILMKLGKGAYWYNTLIVFPLGVFYSLVKGRIEKITMKNDINYLLILFLATSIFFIAFKYRFEFGIQSYSLWSVSFIVLVLLITMKIEINNEVLKWLGMHVFSIYILQRLIMITLNYFGYTLNHRYICLIIVFVGTCLLAAIFDKCFDKLLNKNK